MATSSGFIPTDAARPGSLSGLFIYSLFKDRSGTIWVGQRSGPECNRQSKPIGVDRDGYTFLYLVTRDVPVDFRAFLERHAELVRAFPHWTLRLVPRHTTDAILAYQAAVP